MRQYFYLVTYGIKEDVQVPGKIFLQEHDAVRWGKTLATKNPEYSVSLYKQEIARTAMIQFVKKLTPYKDL